MAKGKVYLVGAGPGDPGLLTLRAKDLLSRADAVLYDALIHPKILEFIPAKAEKIFRGHRGQKNALSQGKINDLLVRLAKKGKMTVRLKGGDPFVFGRGAEEILALQKHKVPFEVVPGVSSSIAVPAYAGIPVTHREMNSSLTIVTGHEAPSKDTPQVDWRNLAENTGTLVFLMGLHTLKNVREKLLAAGKSGKIPAAVIQHGTRPTQRTVMGTLSNIYELVQKARLKAPAILVVGDVVSMRSQVYWLQHKPLFGMRILITRTRDQSSYLSGLMAEQGAEMIEIPTIEIYPLPLDTQGKGYLKEMSEYDWVIFSSSNAVDLFMENLKKMGGSYLDLNEVRIACVGEATAKTLAKYGAKADLVPPDYKQEGLVEAFKTQPVEGQKILFARAKEGRDLLIDFLKKKGAQVDLWALYENKMPVGTRERLVDLFKNEGGVDLLTFASSSSVDHFYGAFTPLERKKWLKNLPVAVIGPVTGQSVKKWGGKVTVMPKKHTMPDLIKGIELWAKRQKPTKY